MVRGTGVDSRAPAAVFSVGLRAVSWQACDIGINGVSNVYSSAQVKKVRLQGSPKFSLGLQILFLRYD